MISLLVFWALLAYFLLTRVFRIFFSEAWCISFLTFFFLVYVSTETLSLCKALTATNLGIFWFLMTIVVVVGIFSRWRSSSIEWLVWRNFTQASLQQKYFWALVTIASINLFVAVLSPPNTWDSMTYHMSRVAHWIQNQQVTFFPTSIQRQNHSMPLAEFAILHLQLLSNSDYLANLVQWFSYVTCIIAAMLLAKDLSASEQGQWISGLFVATLPMAIFQSNSTKNDLLVAALCLLFMVFLLRFMKELQPKQLILCALALGMALLTKGSSYIYCASIGLVSALFYLFKSPTLRIRLKMFGLLLVIVSLGLSASIGHYWRNYSLYDHPLSTKTKIVRNDQISFVITFANITRNAASQLSVPIQGINEGLTTIVTNLLGQETNNPESTFEKSQFKLVYYLNEDFAGNPLHFLLILLTFVIAARFYKKNNYDLNILMCVVVAAFVLFSTFIKWQPWGSRLLLPVFIMASPVVGIVLSSLNTRRFVSHTISFLLILCSLPYLLMNNSRPIIPRYDLSIISSPRMQLYFANQIKLHDEYNEAVRLAVDTGVSEIGLATSEDSWEYPIWVLAQRHASKGLPTFRHILVKNRSSSLLSEDHAAPKIILSTFKIPTTIDGVEFSPIYIGKTLYVFRALDYSDKGFK